MRRNIAGAALAVLGLALASPALAGLKESSPVQVWLNADGSGSFGGQMADTRAAAAAKAYLSCGTVIRPAPDSSEGYCWALDGGNLEGACNTRDPALVKLLGRLHSDSWVYVEFDSAGRCTYAEVEQSSSWAPKAP